MSVAREYASAAVTRWSPNCTLINSIIAWRFIMRKYATAVLAFRLCSNQFSLSFAQDGPVYAGSTNDT